MEEVDSSSGRDLRSGAELAKLAMLATVVVLLIGVVDYVTGRELRVYPLYMLPISFVAWRAGLWPGLVACTVATAVWLMSNVSDDGTVWTPAVLVLNTAAQLTAFSVVVVLVAHLQRSRAAEARLARVDPLTGLYNSRAFREQMNIELTRQTRHPMHLALAYLDLDGFKGLNDKHGHATGDEALRTVARAMRTTLRATDIISRTGGDEFAILMPATGRTDAEAALQRLRVAVNGAMASEDWAVTCSIGALCWNEARYDGDKLLSEADRVMYEVKHDGRDGVRLKELPEKSSPSVNPL